MEKSIEEEENLVVVTEVVKEEESPSQPERRNTRRRLIQSTLFPHKPQVNESKGLTGEDDGNREEENFTSPSSKRKCKDMTKNKTKQTTPKKAKTKQTTPKKAHVMDKESLERGVENGNSPVTAGKRSNRRLKDKWQGDVSPCKDLTPDSSTRPCCRPIMTNCTLGTAEDIDLKSEHAPGPVFNLRLEAKLAAEENARLFAGRQTHPFFSSRKVKKKSQETLGATELENKCCSVLQDDNTTSCPPIHVFEMLQDELSVDWRNWIFCDHTFLSSSGVQENASSSVFEGSVQPLSFIDSLMFSNSVVTTSLQNDMPLNQSPSQIIDMSTTKPTASSVIANFLVSPHHPEYLQTDNEVNGVVSSLGYTDTISNTSIVSEGIFSEERVKSYDNGCDSQSDNSLWTTKYQPKMASEVCGNGESVRFLNDWLRSWHERNLQTSANSSRGNKCNIQDSDYSLEENDSDTESMDEALKNVLLVTGPVGSGKSAAIYACAKEQGFEVIEVSTSDWRNGAHVKQKFGEAMESHRFPKWSVEDPVGSQMKHSLESPSPQMDKSSTQGFDSDVELIPGPCEEEPEVVILGSTEVFGKANIASSRRGAKTLILFEDVDTIFDEDRGLIATIQQLAETAKRPIILTSNSLNPVLPHQLDRLELSFTLPSSKELLTYLYTVCAAEKVNIPLVLIERLIGCCQGDIRKMILLLQFWCQGKRMNKGRRLQYTYGPLQLDLDAGHWVLPKVTPWGFPCQLSEVVEKEITKSLTMENENALLQEVVEEEEFSYEDIQDILEMGFNKETNMIQAKKEAMFSRNGFFNDANEFITQYDNVAEISNSSGSPVAFARRTAKRRISTVLSSLSEDELWSENIPGFPHMLSTGPSNETLTGISGEHIAHTVASLEYLDPSKHMLSTGPSKKTSTGISGEHLAHTVASPDYLDPSTAQLYHSEREAEQDQCKFSETESGQRMCDTYKSVDLSCVPESSYVLETEIKDGTEFSSKTICCADASVTLKEVSSSGVKSIEGMDTLNVDRVIPELYKSSKTILGTDCDIDAELVNGDEEVGDSHNEHEVTASRAYQAMDECSRADFHMAIISVEGCCHVKADSVQETWKKLRNCHAELNSYITSEQKEACRIARLVSGVTDLISEADLMHGCCQPLFRDSLELSLLPSVEPDVIFSYDKCLEMTSTTVQHGLCLFGKESVATESNLHFKNRVDFAWEMLTFTTDTTELGKLVTRDMSASQSLCTGKALERPRNVLSLKREVEERIYNTIQELVPSRLYLALKGSAFHEYMSSLGQISKSEASRLLENIDKPRQRRRARVARHYLSTGQMMLSPEEASLLAQHCCYGSKASQVLTKESRDYT